ncbi:hypothetical protein Tco_0901585 [Tanacetum coccineum]
MTKQGNFTQRTPQAKKQSDQASRQVSKQASGSTNTPYDLVFPAMGPSLGTTQPTATITSTEDLQRAAFTTPPQTAPGTNTTEPPPPPIRNKGPELGADNLTLEGVATELAPSDFVSQNYETLVALMQEEINNPELIKRLNDRVPQTFDELMKCTRSFIQGEAAAADSRKGYSNNRSQEQSRRQSNDQSSSRNNSYRGQRGGRGNDKYTPLTMTPKEILATEGANFPRPPPMRTPEEQRVGNGYSTYPEQEVSIGGSLSDTGRAAVCALLQRNLDIFAWEPKHMNGVPRSITEHKLKIRQGYSPVRQKKRGQALERAKAILEEVHKLVEAGIMREVYYHDWLSNPVMVKKSDGSWRMCVDFTDLNKACPQDCYPLPEIDWKSMPMTLLSRATPKTSWCATL